jgi:hypothetical protein
MAVSKAWTDFSRPTNKGKTMCGKTTTSRKGSKGNAVLALYVGAFAIKITFYIEYLNLWLSNKVLRQIRLDWFFSIEA